MARITLPFVDTLTTQLQNPTVDESKLTKLASTTVAGYGNALDQAFYQADNFREKAHRADIMAVEAENNAKLTKVIPEAMKEIGGVIMDTTDKIIRINEQERKFNEAKDTEAFMLSEGNKLEEDYLYFQDQQIRNPSSDSAKAALEWFGNRIEQGIKNAPNEDAKLRFLQHAQQLKISALRQGLSLSRAAEKQQRISQIESGVRSVGKQAKFNPLSDPSGYIARAAELGNALRNEGASETEVTNLTKNAINNVLSSNVEGFIEKGDPRSAIEQLANPTVNTSLPASEFERLGTNAARDMLKLKLNSNSKIDLAIGMSMMEDGTIVPGMEGANKVADTHFLNYISQALPGGENINQSNYNAISTAVSSYFDKYNKIIGKETKAYLVDKVNESRNPYEVAGYSLALDKLVNDPTSNSKRIVPDLIKSPKDVEELGNALTIGRLVKIGIDPKEAVDQVRKNQIHVNPALKEAKDQELQKYLQESSGKTITTGKFKDLTEDTLGSHWFTKDPENYSEIVPEVRETFIAAYKMTNDIESAKKITQAKIKSRYSETSINGRKEIMNAAPELYFNGQAMEHFKTQYHNAVKELNPGTYSKENKIIENGKEISVDLMPIYGYTENQPTFEKTYMLKKSNGQLVTNPNGTYATFNFKLDQDAYTKNVEEYKKSLEQKDLYYRDESKLREKMYKDLDKMLEGADPKLRSLVLDNLKRDQ